jgi:cation/acetate symporter
VSGTALATLVVLGVATLAIAFAARPRGSATTVDFYLAGQRVGMFTNASAICGDYFSAASFLGVAAAVYASGLDGMWYAAGFAAGFVPVLLFIAAPLRRFGRYSIPDFLGNRFSSEPVRVVAVVVVQLVVLGYLVPQAVGSGLTWELLVGVNLPGLSPYATGIVVANLAVAALVMIGGMRGATWNQAVQFLFLLGILLWLAAVVHAGGFSYPQAVGDVSVLPLHTPVQAGDGWVLEPVADHLRGDGSAARFGLPGARYGVLGQFALLLTLTLGTAGLPHVMNRFFTSPTGRAARTTTVWVLGLAGIFYMLAVLLGTAARTLSPAAAAEHPWLASLTVEGILRVPEHSLLALGQLRAGTAGLAVVAAGAIVAILSTISGLLIAAAASWGHDVYERYINPQATQTQAVRAGKLAVLVMALASTMVALALEPSGLTTSFPSIVAQMVTWAFALAGSALTPAMVLAIWWRRTTAKGALAGMIAGGTVALALIVIGLWHLSNGSPLPASMLSPTVVAAPTAFAVTVVVSRASSVPDDLPRLWLRLHGTAGDRTAERLVRLAMGGVRS